MSIMHWLDTLFTTHNPFLALALGFLVTAVAMAVMVYIPIGLGVLYELIRDRHATK